MSARCCSTENCIKIDQRWAGRRHRQARTASRAVVEGGDSSEAGPAHPARLGRQLDCATRNYRSLVTGSKVQEAGSKQSISSHRDWIDSVNYYCKVAQGGQHYWIQVLARPRAG